VAQQAVGLQFERNHAPGAVTYPGLLHLQRHTYNLPGNVMTQFRSAVNERTPLLPSTSTTPAPQAAQGSWKNNFFLKLRTPQNARSPEFNALITKLFSNAKAILTADEVNDWIFQCMIKGEVDVLGDILAQEPFHTLRIRRSVDECAWQTLLAAMPASCSIRRVNLHMQQFDEASTSRMFQAFGAIPNLESLDFDWCSVPFFRARFNRPSCPPLPKLQNLFVKNSDNPDILVDEILKASPKVGTLHLETNAGLSDEVHHLFVTTLVERHVSTLQNLTLRGLRDERCLARYAALLKKSTALTHLDVSMENLSPSTCHLLMEAALNGQPGLTSLSLVRCWPHMPVSNFDWGPVAGLVSLKSLVSLDLSRNAFPSSMKPVLLAISEHPSLQSLDLSDVTLSDKLITEELPFILERNKRLTSLQLPTLNDIDLVPLINAMESNYSLQSLSIRSVEQRLFKLPAEVAQQLYPNYLALMEVLARNRRAREVALMEGAMQTVLGGLTRRGPAVVPLDIARYAAQHVANNGTDNNEAIALTLIDKRAHEKALEALKRLRLQEKK
jgi:hypothetical protein